MLGSVRPGARLRLEALGRVVPVGWMVMKLSAVGVMAVMLIAMAATPVVGMPPRPGMGRSRDSAGPKVPGPCWVPSLVAAPGRVSSRRAGVSPVKPVPGAVVGPSVT